MESLPTALVLTWTADTLRVRCLFCLSSHGHGIGPKGYTREGQRRVSDCSEGETHRLTYPDEPEFDGMFDWELDRKEKLIYTVTQEGKLRDPHQSRSLGDQRRRLEEHQGLSKEEEVSVAEPGVGKAKYPKDDNVNVVDHEDGNGILLAATEDAGLNTVKWLQEKGVSMNKANYYGRTALMEAALWGRLETVQYLVDNNVNINDNDANGHSASDLAMDSEQNEEERIRRANDIVKEHTDANRKRGQILAYLKLKETKETETEQNTIPYRATPPKSSHGFFLEKGNSIWFYKLETNHEFEPSIGDKRKAFARLDRGPGYSMISAMSGHSQGHRMDVLNNEIWTQKVQALCQAMNYPIAQSYASHVEMQLIAYYIDRQWIFDQEDLSMKAEGDHRSLKDVLPSPPPATIVVSKVKICGNCSKFWQRFRELLPDIPSQVIAVGV